MKTKRTLILLGILLLCALCFGGGVFFGQYQLQATGFRYFDTIVAVDINTADKETLMTEAGIGSVTAERIIASRAEDGKFKDIHELVERKILGEGLLTELSPRITVN